jgi:hypothetical protein
MMFNAAVTLTIRLWRGNDRYKLVKNNKTKVKSVPLHAMKALQVEKV